MKSCIIAVAVAALLSRAAFAADVNGKWAADIAGWDGQTRTSTFTLNGSGSKLSGILRGPRGREFPISEGRIQGDTISFLRYREPRSKSGITGAVSGNEIKLMAQREGAGRGQQFTAKRTK